MFPDKFHTIISGNTDSNISTEHVTNIEKTGSNTLLPEAPLVVSGTTSLEHNEVISTGTLTQQNNSANNENIPEAIVIATGNDQVVSVSGLIHSVATGDIIPESTLSGSDTTESGFDAFTEIEGILDKANPYQEKIDILNNFLSE